MDVADVTGDQPREEIVRLEARIDELRDKLENCRKVAVAARIAIGVGVAIFAAGLTGIVRFDIMVVLASITAVIGGLVLLGSNDSTANEVADEMAKVEAARVSLIGSIRLRVVGSDTLH